MPTYSPTGYVVAVTIRRTRTLLVEGSTDKSVIARLTIELRNHGLLNADDVVIDTTADIENAPGARLGNREKVEYIHGLVGGLQRFAGLVDREFREFQLAPPIDHAPYHRVVPPNLFWTRGHSIENYFHTLAIVTATLEQHHPEHLPARYSDILAAAFPGILRACATICLAALGIFKLDRIREVKLIDFWRIDPTGSVTVDVNELQAILAARGVSAEDLALFVGHWHYYSPLLAAADVVLSQWICHGHLAESHLWCAVAALFRHFGMPDAVATQIAWGTKDAQFRTASERWCQSCAAGAGEYPQEFVQWLQG
jgi:hypothetical protein